MPLRYVDPTRPTNLATRSSRSRFGQFIAKNLASRTDPWLGRISDYARLYGLAERYYAGFADYRTKTAQIGRDIPVFRLTPR